MRGKRGRGAGGKIPVIGLHKRGENVYPNVVKNCSKAELMPIITGRVLEGTDIYTDGWKACDGLVLKGYEHHRIHHHQNQFARGKNHVNGIESFWSYAKFRFLKLRGVRKDRFLLHLKECEWRLTIAALNFTHCSFRSSAKTLSQLHKTHLYLADTPGLLIMAFYF